MTQSSEPLAYDQFTCSGQDINSPDSEPALLHEGEPFRTIMTGTGLIDATAESYGQTGASWVVSFTLHDNGDRVDAFKAYVANNPNRAIAIVLNGRLMSYPIIKSGLASSAAAGTMDGGIITGNFTRDEARILAAQLSNTTSIVSLRVKRVEVVFLE